MVRQQKKTTKRRLGTLLQVPGAGSDAEADPEESSSSSSSSGGSSSSSSEAETGRQPGDQDDEITCPAEDARGDEAADAANKALGFV